MSSFLSSQDKYPENRLKNADFFDFLIFLVHKNRDDLKFSNVVSRHPVFLVVFKVEKSAQ